MSDPDFNIKVVIDAVSKIESFRSATTLDDAVMAFVVHFERPANPAAAVAKRQAIAQGLVIT